jgi:cytochrome c-type biogenesis protein
VLTATATLALGAGMLAALNPCGFALLPAYLTLLVTGDQPNRLVAVARALKMTVVMTAGFTAVFAVFGLVVAPVASSAQRFLPWFSLLVGLAIAAAGLWLLLGRNITIPKIASRGGAPLTRSTRSMFGFGVSYALASLTCTIAPFLAVVVSAFRADSWATGTALFLLYAAGMGLVVGTAALAVALAQQSLVRSARRLGRLAPAAGGTLLLVVGAYVAYYGWWEIRVLRGAPTDDPVIDAAAAVQHWLANTATGIGAGGFALALGGALAVLVLARATRTLLHRPGAGDSVSRLTEAVAEPAYVEGLDNPTDREQHHDDEGELERRRSGRE